MVEGKQVKDCWGKKGGGENEKGENGFPLLIFSPNPQFLYFSPTASFPLNGSWREWFSPFLIIIIYSVCPILHKPCRLVQKLIF